MLMKHSLFWNPDDLCTHNFKTHGLKQASFFNTYAVEGANRIAGKLSFVILNLSFEIFEDKFFIFLDKFC